MEWDQFWRIIAAAYRADGLDRFAALTDELDRLTWFEVVAFQARFDAAVAAAMTPDLRAAAALVQGVDSDAAFRDFRVWLVARGRGVYDAAILNPDTLADVLDGDPVDGFGLDGAAVRVYEAKTGMSDFRTAVARLSETMPPPHPVVDGLYFAGESESRTRFPRLAALYPQFPDGADDGEAA